MRITNRMLAENALRNTSANLQAMSVSQNQIGSGRKLTKPSDDPAQVLSAIQATDGLAQITQYLRNIDVAQQQTSAADSALADAASVVQRARELAVEGANGTLSDTDRQAIAAEVDQLTAQLAADAGAKVGDSYIFNGYQSQTPPYSYTPASGTTAGVVTGTPDTSAVMARVGPGVQVQVNTSAVDAFKPALDALTQLYSDLESGGTVAGTTLSALDDALNSVTQARATVGARTNRLDQSQATLQAQQLAVTKLLSDTEDVDMASAISLFQQQQLTYNAALQVSGKILQTSLIDVLK